jgi:hypothetical protein
MPFTDLTNEQVVGKLALEGDQTKKLLKLLDRSGLNISDFDSVDSFFDQVRLEGDGGTLGKGGHSAQNRVNSIVKLMGAGGINAPGGVGGMPTFANPQMSSIKVAMGDENPQLGSVPDQAADIQRFLAQQRGSFLGAQPGQPQLQSPFGAPQGQPLQGVNEQTLLGKGTTLGKATLKKLGLI